MTHDDLHDALGGGGTLRIITCVSVLPEFMFTGDTLLTQTS